MSWFRKNVKVTQEQDAAARADYSAKVQSMTRELLDGNANWRSTLGKMAWGDALQALPDVIGLAFAELKRQKEANE